MEQKVQGFCSDSKLLPLAKTCGILREYCRFIEIVELNFNKRHPRRSFQKAIEQAMDEGILVDYLDRKSREVINMLCAQYSYKLDIAEKKKEAFQDGMQAGLEKGISQGAQQKAVEAALLLINEYKEKPEVAAQKMNASLKLVLEALKQK